jgi:hypothetical protein
VFDEDNPDLDESGQNRRAWFSDSVKPKSSVSVLKSIGTEGEESKAPLFVSSETMARERVESTPGLTEEDAADF